MSEHFNNQDPVDKLKNTKVNRATAITAAILVAVLAIVIAATVSANRSKQNELPVDTDTRETETDRTETETEQTPETETQKPAETQVVKPADTDASPVEDALPSFVLPVSGVLSKKHDPELQVYSNTMNDYRVHLGLDIVTEENAPVYAAADGTIARIWKDVLMGYCVAVQHNGGALTVYKNLGEELPTGIAEGVTVRSGQLIATVGESAMVEIAEEPHLHFELVIDDLSVDPLEYFSEKALESLSMDGSHGE